VEELLNDLGAGKKIFEKAGALRRFQESMADAEAMTPLSKYVALKRALGEPVDKELQAIMKYEPGFEALSKLEAMGVPPSEMEKNLAQVARFKGAKLPIGSTGALVGGMMGGVPGALVGAGVDV